MGYIKKITVGGVSYDIPALKENVENGKQLLKMDEDGLYLPVEAPISATNVGLSLDFADGLELTADGLTVNCGTGLGIYNNTVGVNLGSSLGVYNNAIGVNATYPLEIYNNVLQLYVGTRLSTNDNALNVDSSVIKGWVNSTVYYGRTPIGISGNTVYLSYDSSTLSLSDGNLKAVPNTIVSYATADAKTEFLKIGIYNDRLNVGSMMLNAGTLSAYGLTANDATTLAISCGTGLAIGGDGKLYTTENSNRILASAPLSVGATGYLRLNYDDSTLQVNNNMLTVYSVGVIEALTSEAKGALVKTGIEYDRLGIGTVLLHDEDATPASRNGLVANEETTLAVSCGKGVKIDDGFVTLKLGSGLKFADDGTLTLNINEESNLQIYDDGSLF